MIETLLLVSLVTATHLPSRLAATPSGSMPTTSAEICLPVFRSIAVAVPPSSFEA